MFDPYGEWLGIPKERRPITYYALLGLSPKEADREAIEDAAADRVELLHEHRDGPHGTACARLLTEIEHARATLLSPTKRREYDAKLRKAAAPPVAEVELDDEDDEVADDEPKSSRARGGKSVKRRREEPKKKSRLPLILGGAFGLLLLTGVGAAAAYFLVGPKKTSNTAPIVAEGTTSRSETVPTPTTSTPAAPTGAAPAPTPPAPTVPAPTPPATVPTPEAPAPTPPAVPPPAPPKPPEPKPAPKTAKMPVPDDAAQAKAEQPLKEQFKAEYSKPRSEDRLALSAKFLQPGREDRSNPAAWFVLLREARDLAVQAGRPRLAVEAVEEIDRWFAIDPLAMKIQVLAGACKSGGDLQVAAAYRTALNLIQQAYDAENFDAARKFIDIVDAAVREAKAEQLIKLVAAQRSEIEEYARDFQAVSAARAKLAQAPGDPEANYAVGRYLCFFQNDWNRGLPMMAKGFDPALKALSAKDLAQPADVKGQLDVADGWWNWGKNEKERSQRNLVKRARMWYERAGPASVGADRKIVIGRIKEAQTRDYARFHRLLPGSYYGRDPENRILLLREGGGTMKSEEAVERGLEWLARHQSSSNGIWATDIFHKVAQCKCGDHGDKHDVAGTALGVMPFLGVGETHKKGRYQAAVSNALKYLLRQQKPEGNFSDNAYENALASIAVIESYGLTRDDTLKQRAQLAANYIVRAQFTDGSWGYSANTKGDTSVCGWQFTALKAAAYAKLDVPPATFDFLSGFLDMVADSQELGYGYNAPGATPSTSAVGLLCREFLSWGPGHPGLVKGIDFLLRPENVPTKQRISIYTVFYIHQVAHHFGGNHWEKWNTPVRELLIDLQDKGDTSGRPHQKGSWTPPKDEPHAKPGGRIMFTSLALITLEAYYYHVPLYGYGPYTLLD